MDILDLIRCPSCGGPLHPETGCPGPGSLRCAAGHTFDVSKQGYVNLLPPGRASNQRSGDEAEMLRARRRFLSGGYYDRFSETVSEMAGDISGETVLFDLGSGDGYHTVRAAVNISQKHGCRVLALGFEASKNGATMGCRLAEELGLHSRKLFECSGNAGTEVHFLPANIFRLPAADRCAGLVLSMFAPIPWDEAGRVLLPGGKLIAVSAGPDHLIEMRKVLYDRVETNDFLPEAPAGFRPAGRVSDRYTISVGNPDALGDLLKMTPHYYRATAENRERLLRKDGMELTVDVNCTVFELEG